MRRRRRSQCSLGPASRRSNPAGRSREELFEIPKGTWARRMAGDEVEILPDEIRLTLGIRDVWCCGTWTTCRRFRPDADDARPELPAAVRESRPNYQFACTAHASGQMTVIVEPEPGRRGDGSWRPRAGMRASAPKTDV